MNGPGLLKRIPFLSALAPAHLRDVYRLAREVRLEAGSKVFAKREDADAMFIVVSGRVKIFTDSAGKKRKTYAYLKEGEFFGEMALVEDLPRTASAQAVEPTRLLLIRKTDFQRLLARDPRLALYLLKTVCARLRRANEDLESMLFRNILGRVAQVVLQQARRSGEPWKGEGLALKERFTQQELADLVGTTREPLTRALSSLRRAGLVGVTDDGRYAVPEPRKLAGLCSND
ncbi:MAG TPA: Crp/Fnr family transcriptional regulator [Elusimicrobiota bacterium]|nr:Crp/Fnr family transcriptional regulator [Elusimicrobiota bacterium]